MDDIKVFNALQTLVPACGQVRLHDRGDGGGACLNGGPYGFPSVGAVLLAVRNGKRGSR